ncbi:MAG: MATE family efflux transporter [Clostridiales bacterium]|nr:MATE family efflux transporter [Clostridiales bacterium]
MSETKKKNKSTNMDLTLGEPLKVIILFSLPLLLSNLFQQFYNLTDTAIIGHALGDDALSAIGTVSPLFSFYTTLIFGFTNGFAVIISNCFGSKDEARLKRACGTSIIIGIICTLFISVFGLLFLDLTMDLLGVPENLFNAAKGYIFIVIAALPLTFAYNICASFLRAIGNSIAPLVILICSAILNIGLDLLFVCVLDKGLKGAALATAISQLISATICMIYIVRSVPLLHIKASHLKPDPKQAGNIFVSGLSFSMMFTIVNVGTLFLQRSINGLGDITIAAHQTARKIDSFCMMPISTIASAMATFSGQNHGAAKHSRINEGIKKSFLASCAVIVVLILMIFLFGDKLSYLISGSKNDEIISLSHKYLKWNLPFFFVLSILCLARTTLQGVGSKIAPLACSMIEMVMKVIVAERLVGIMGYNGIIICEPLTWIACAIFICIVYANNKHLKRAKIKADIS